MNNPIEIGRNLKKSYLQYIKAGIPLMEEYYEKERERLYEDDGVIMHPPYIEIVRKYEGKKTLSEICKENQINMEVANFINRGLLISDEGEERYLYEHQEKAIIDVLKNKKNMVITTGTGSGKTESFLIPLLANIIEESLSWKTNEKETALRAIIFYPLNALAEDQMVRLRKSLAREEVTKWYKENGIKDTITFGRYIGRTPRDKKDPKYREIQFRWDSIKYNIENSNEEEQRKLQNLIYSGPCCEKESPEIVDRKNMQENPPDILITNYSMLNIMLMRKIEQSIFEKTREWLKSDKKNTFTLVIDELHTYRGTAGTEIAYIIKVLLKRLGLSPSSSQVRFLASSASMSDTVETQKYISDFFGTDNNNFSSLFSLITDKQEKEIFKNSLPPIPVERLNEIKRAEGNSGVLENTIMDVFKNTKAITDFVKTHKLVDWLRYSLLNNETGQLRAKSTPIIASILFNTKNIEESSKLFEIFLLLITHAEGGKNLPYQPLRAHYFLRNIEKIYMCINKDCDAVDLEFRNGNRQYGKMYNQPLIRCSCGSLVYEAIVCRHCGELYFCGYIDNDGYVKNIPDIYNQQKPQVFYMPDISLYSDGVIDNWLKINFNIKNGHFEQDRYSKHFIYKGNPKVKPELPISCPRCDFTTRNSDFSALFRHGTGVQKINQVCADNIMQILARSDEKRKLVIFSDSRQSAAKLAAGIELDHYRDALRQTVLRSFESNAFLLNYLNKWRNDEAKKIPEEYMDLIKNDNYLRGIRRSILEEREGDLTKYEKETLDKQLSSTDAKLEYIISNIMKELIKAGINPAGPYPSIAYVDPKTEEKKWYECVNADLTGFETDTDQKEEYYKKINSLCKTEVLRIMLGTPKRSFESLGLGYYHVQSTLDEIEPEFIDSLVRIIGESNRIFSRETEEQRSFPNRLWGYLRVVKNETKQRHPVLDIIIQHFVGNNIINGDADRRLTGNDIVFIPSKPGDNIWICKKCKTKHLHKSSGKCTYCFADLPDDPESIKSDDIYNTYYTQKRNIDKLHCEELTGQTNTQDALNRQRLFQDIFYAKERSNIDNIELLSVTTTMEAGVDIGALLAIMLGNVPPQRFNYQQRIGRAGRRGSSLSIALTVARANSHDLTHYTNPDRIVSGNPAPPYLDFSSMDIFRRIVYKEVLKRAFEDCKIDTDENDNIHGQFGKVSDWDIKNKQIIVKWLKNQNNIVSDYNYLISKFDSETVKSDKRKILNNIQLELIDNIDKSIKDQNFNQIYLSERLAAGGRLPMFGFPTQVRYLYEAKPKRFPAEDVTDRPMDLALATFAPGSEIVKDKKVYLSVGFIDFELKNGSPVPIDGLVKYQNKVLFQCPVCWYTAIPDNSDMERCPICEHEFDQMKGEICNDICSPKGYCVDFNEPVKDFDGNFNWNPVKVNSRLDSEITRKIELKHIDNTNLQLGNNIIPDTGVARTINTNGGELFTIRKTKDNIWVVPDLVNIPTSITNERQIALVATKITGIIILALNNINDAICINPLHKGIIDEINKVRPQLIKSAFLSWGELLRKSVADFLDIRSNELSVDYSVRRDSPDTIPYPSIYMMEQLENGAGYTDYLASLASTKKREIFINTLIKDGNIYEQYNGKHKSFCDTSCYDCLCNYNNQQQHGLLNWRLGFDVIQLSNNINQISCYTQENSYWHSILSKTENIIAKHNPNTKVIKKNDYWYMRSEKGNTFIYHPLWSDKYILEKTKEIKYNSEKVNYLSLLEFINNPI